MGFHKFYHDYHKPKKTRQRKEKNRRKGLRDKDMKMMPRCKKSAILTNSIALRLMKGWYCTRWDGHTGSCALTARWWLRLWHWLMTGEMLP